MTLLEEYKRQNNWRCWNTYIERLPLSKNQLVYDLGCSTGFVSELLSKKVDKVIGFDMDEILLDEARNRNLSNCEFILSDISTIDTKNLEKCDGIWFSFALAYIVNPNKFILDWSKCLKPNGWFAIVDIDGLFSSHIPNDNKYYNRLLKFENESKIYNFNIGSKIKPLLEENNFEVIILDNDCYDAELNFKGQAPKEILDNWHARLNRMIKLKEYLGNDFNDFSKGFLSTLSSSNHTSSGSVKFCVGIKK